MTKQSETLNLYIMSQNNSTEASAIHQHRSIASVMLEFLGSMNLAITLLVSVAIASVIGTVLLQNQVYTQYISKFGGFWFEFFLALGLYDVYSSWWFLVILGFLVTSTSVCVYRNAPTKLREMRHYRLNAQEKSLRTMHHNNEWLIEQDKQILENRATLYLQNLGYRMRRKDHGDHVVLAGMRGAASRFGYLFTHVAIVIICIGGLIDGNVWLKLKEISGELEILKQDILIKDIPAINRLANNENFSFRGNFTIPEGGSINGVRIDVRDGYIWQELPFTVEVKDFRIEYYQTGQPKSFESDLVIHDEQLKEPLAQTIAVNHPLLYRGHAIYQASFGDGGSKLKLQAWPLSGNVQNPVYMDTEVFTSLKLETDSEPLSMEVSDFRMFNINPEENKESGKTFRNWGPSFLFKLRNAAGEANEYNNFMSPVERDGRLFIMSGVRKSLEDDFRYLRIPADTAGSINRFMRFRAKINDTLAVNEIINESARLTLESMGKQDAEMAQQLKSSLNGMLNDFTSGGTDAIMSRMEGSMSAEQMQSVGPTYFNALRSILAAIYKKVLEDEGIDISKGVTNEADQQFFEDSFIALGILPNYASPFYFQLASFEQIEATGLQITRSPGKNLVYLGSVFLIAGIFIMFYMNHKRAWVVLKEQDGKIQILFAGTASRRTLDYDREFEQISQGVERSLKQQTE